MTFQDVEFFYATPASNAKFMTLAILVKAFGQPHSLRQWLRLSVLLVHTTVSVDLLAVV